jgi:hypothetical protein
MPVRQQRPGEYEQLVEALRGARPRLPLVEEEIQELARRARMLDMMHGEVLMRQGGAPDYLYYLLSGQLRAADVSGDQPRLLNYHAARTFVGEQGMLNDKPRAATVDVISDARLAVWDRSDFNWLLSLNDQVRPYFEELYRHRELRARRPFPGKQWDEVTVVRTGKHPLMLLNALIGPVLFLLFGLVVLLIGLSLGEEYRLLVGLLAGFPGFIALVWGVYNFLDWRNDEFIVTSKRVIYIQRFLLYGEERDEAPLIRIQDVTVEASNLLERILNFYDLTIQTAGAGKIRFKGLRSAEEIKETIFQERVKAMERREAVDVYGIRKALAQRMNRQIPEVEMPVDTLAPTSGLFERGKRQLPPLLDYLWPRTTVVKDDTVIWRKHLFIWLSKTWPAQLTFLILLALMILVLLDAPPFDGLPQSAWLLGLLLAVAALLAFLWYIYLYDDWHKDIYIVTRDRIVDVDSSSFRIRGEQRREGTFDVIQNITYSIPTFFHKLLNMGNVIIETAGTAETFTFKGVFDPSAVQQEIFNRMVAYQEQLRREQRVREDTSRAEWFQEYHQMHVQEDHPGH